MTITMQLLQLCTEITLLRMLSHENIVKFLGTRIDHDHGHLSIFMELVSGGSLHQIVRDYGPLPESLVQNYTRQVSYRPQNRRT
jgi:serine/threonine protein kinase